MDTFILFPILLYEYPKYRRDISCVVINPRTGIIYVGACNKIHIVFKKIGESLNIYICGQ